MREAYAFLSHAIQIRRGDIGTVTTQISKAEVVGQDHDDVRRTGLGVRGKGECGSRSRSLQKCPAIPVEKSTPALPQNWLPVPMTVNIPTFRSGNGSAERL